MEGEIQLDRDQRDRASYVEPQVIDDPMWASFAIIWQRDRIATLEAELAKERAEK